MQIDSYDSPDAVKLLLAGQARVQRRHARREVWINAGGAVAFLLAAGALAVLAPWRHALTLGHLVPVLLTYVGLNRVKFPVAGGWMRPTTLAFVPMLFVLPTPVVPLVVMLAIMLAAVPDFLRGRMRPAMLPMLVIDAWYSVGASLVLVLAGTGRFSWSEWPIYVGVLFAQLLFDATAAVTWSWAVEQVSPRVQLPLLCWTYVIDAALAPLGLVIAASSVERPGLVLFALSPAAMLMFFARERQQRLKQTQALTTAYRGTALLLGELVEADDHYTGAHSRDVVDLSLAVADSVGLDSGRRRDVEFAALLHDVGKMRVSKDIINKRGPLDPAEWEVIRRHTIDGELMLRRVGGALSNVGRIVRSSHERFDGAGYPDGLAGEAIPLESRIVSVCDSYSAMTTDRPYRAAMSAGQAIVELHRCAGTQFDPEVIDALTRVLGTAIEAVQEPAQTPQTSPESGVQRVSDPSRRSAQPRPWERAIS